MQKNTYFIISIFVIIPFLCLAQKDKDKEKDLTVKEYIAHFKGIAIQEMERSEIPASITLAQGIHESAYGNSNLAKKSNNHFGIKCTKDWEGDRVKKWDDEANKSCFRVYKSAEHSYVDHTDFLLNRKHYAFLFDYGRRDYEKWAKGLRKAGYATDPKYPDKLIRTIEKYKLAQFDKVTGVLAYDTKESPEIKDISANIKKRKPRSFLFKARKPTLYRENDCTYAVSRKGESALAAAKRFGIPYARFLKFNDLKDGSSLIDYQPVYIQPKKSKYRGDETFYEVQKDITMYEIAQYYGVKLPSLLSRNLMVEGEEPMNGETIQLKEKSLVKPKLRSKNHIDSLPPKYIDDKPATKKNAKSNKPKAQTVSNVVKRPAPQELEVGTPTYSKRVYADTAHFNTSKSTDKDYLDIKVTAGGDLATTNPNTEDNPFDSNRNTKPVNQPNNPYTSTKGNRTSNNNSSNATTRNKANSNNPYKSSPFNSDAYKVYSTTNNNPNKVSNPRIKDGSLYDNNKNTAKVNPVYGTTKPKATTNPVVATLNTRTQIHLVQKGQTLYAIHRLYNVSVDAIKKVNKLSGNAIKAGERLTIPVR